MIIRGNDIDIRNVLLASLLSSSLYLSALISPLVGGILNFFAPLPLVYIGVTNKNYLLYICIALSSILVFVVSGKFSLALYLIQYIMPFFLLFEFFNRGFKGVNTIFIVSVLTTFLSILLILLFSGWDIYSLTNDFTSFINSNFQAVLQSYKEIGVSESDIATIKNNLSKISYLIVRILPSLMIIFYSSLFFLNLSIVRRAVKSDIGIVDISNWSLPFWVVWVFILAGFEIFLIKYPPIKWITFNILILCCYLFLIQGFSVIEFCFEKLNYSKIMKNIFYIFIFFSQFLLILVALAGLFDNWFNFRKIINNNNLGGRDENNT